MTIIREASEQDVDRLVEYGRTFWEQTLYFEDGVDYDAGSVIYMTRWLLEEGVAIYAEKAGKPVGLLLAVVGPFPMNNSFQAATEWVFYVDPEVRKEGVGQRLIAFATEILRARGVKYLSMISLANVQPEAAEGLYKSLGFRHTESSFTKDLG